MIFLRNGKGYPITESKTQFLVFSTEQYPVDITSVETEKIMGTITGTDSNLVYQVTCDPNEMRSCLDKFRQTYPDNDIYHVYHWAQDPTPIWITNRLMITFAPSSVVIDTKLILSEFGLHIEELMEIGDTPLYICNVKRRNPIKVLNELWQKHGPGGDQSIIDADISLINHAVPF